MKVVKLLICEPSPTCPANLDGDCGSDDSAEWVGEFFPSIPENMYEDWLRFSVAFWHSGTGGEMWPWEDGTNSLAMAKRRMRANFEFLVKLGVDRWCFRDRDIAPDAETLEETRANLDEVVALAKELQVTKIRPLWGMAKLFMHPRYMHGGATSTEIGVYAYAAAQVQKAIEAWFFEAAVGYKKKIGFNGIYAFLFDTVIKRLEGFF
ncbi:putative xylose isomerase [Helianthus annuus]|nr:putative xylose isomerase [Helianthus annuus]